MLYDDDDEERFTDAFELQSQRQQFVRRVFALITLALLLTVVQAFAAIEIPAVKEFLIQNYRIVYFAFGFYVVCSITIHCCEVPRKIFPVNLIIFILLVENLTIIVCVVIVYQRQSVLLALISTVGIFFVILLISLFSNIDFTTCSGVLCLLSTVLCTYFFVLFALRFFMVVRLMSIIYSFLAVFVLSLYLLYELQCIFGGRSHELETDEYILGATLIYSDLITIFLHLMKIFKFFK